MILSHQKSKWWKISSPGITTRTVSSAYHCHLVMCPQYLLVAHQHARHLPPEMYVLHYCTAILHPTAAPDCRLSPHLQPSRCSTQTNASSTAQVLRTCHRPTPPYAFILDFPAQHPTTSRGGCSISSLCQQSHSCSLGGSKGPVNAAALLGLTQPQASVSKHL